VAETANIDPFGIVGTVINQKYRVDRIVGAGGYGVVYAATHLLLKQERALKFLRVEGLKDKENALERFLREAQIGTTLAHPGIARVYEVEMWGSTPYVVMELLHGQSLRERLRAVGHGLPWRDMLSIGIQAADALAAAHAREILHRDIKPDNLYLCDDGTTKVVDFGIAFLASAAKITRTGTVVGTPRYMAPEQIIPNSSIDERVDVYALGAVLYTSIAGRRPFGDIRDELPLLTTIAQRQRPIDIQALEPSLPDQVVALVRKAMDPERDKRFASMVELKHAAEECLSIEDAAPREIRSQERTVPWTGPMEPVAEGTASKHSEVPAVPAIASVEPVSFSSATEREVSPSAPPRRSRALALTIALGLAIAASSGVGLFVVRRTTVPTRAANSAAPPTTPAPMNAAAPVAPAAKPRGPAPRPAEETPSAPTSTESADEASTGSLSVWAKPFAMVSVDGKTVGETPRRHVVLKPGSHTVELVGPNDQKRTKSIRIEAGKHKTIRIDWSVPEESP